MFLKRCVLLLVLFLTVYGVRAQDLLKSGDLSSLHIDQVSDADILRLQQQMKAAGMSQEQAEQLAASKGLPPAEIAKLRDRLSKLQNTAAPAGRDSTVTTSARRETVPDQYKTFTKPATSSVFGSFLFNTPSLSFEPNLRIATPSGYVLGPDDELQININGYQQASYRAQVQPEGNIVIPEVGAIPVNGFTIEEVTARIREKLSRSTYPTLASGKSTLSITLGRIRSIRVTILGAAKPGSYVVSSLSTVYGALYLGGGPDDISSYREIELIRDGRLYKKIDLYQFLLHGTQDGNVLLKDNDVINIPVYQNRVVINGDVRRPGTYEMLGNETLETLIGFAGGFTEKAYTATVRVKQLTDREHRIQDIPKESFASYHFHKGDEITVSPIIDRLENSVSISGAVYRPGQYELTPGLTLSGLVRKADGTKGDVYLGRALIVRTREDLIQEIIAVNLGEVLAGRTPDIALKREDVVSIASIQDFRDAQTVSIDGEVRKPASFPYHENITLKDILFQAGGFTEAAAAYRIEVSRRINRDNYDTATAAIAEVIDINSDRDLSLQGDHFLLRPFDQVTVRKKPGYFEQKKVTVSGEVLYPGSYTMESKKDRVSDLLRRAGGFTSVAYPGGVSVVRQNRTDNIIQDQKLQAAQAFQSSLRDTNSTAVQQIASPTVRIAVNIDKVMHEPGSKEDLLLEEGDVLDVPKTDLLVKISGEVFAPTKVNFEPDRSIKYYLGRAGGTTFVARKWRIDILYANGQLAKTRHFMGIFRSYPPVKPGAEIIVPRRPIIEKASAGEVVGFAGVLLSMAGVVIAIINSIK